MNYYVHGRPNGGSWEFDWRKRSADHWKDMLYQAELGWRREHAARVWQCLGALACVVNVYCTGCYAGSYQDEIPGWQNVTIRSRVPKELHDD